MKTAELNKMIEKAKDRKDGVYTLSNRLYRVEDNRLTHLFDYGELLIFSHGFLITRGKMFEHYDTSAMRKYLKNIK